MITRNSWLQRLTPQSVCGRIKTQETGSEKGRQTRTLPACRCQLPAPGDWVINASAEAPGKKPGDKPVRSGQGAESPKPAEPAAASAPTAAELLGNDAASENIVKAKGAKNITSGIAIILATFNNTLVSITDMHGNTRVVQRGQGWL